MGTIIGMIFGFILLTVGFMYNETNTSLSNLSIRGFIFLLFLDSPFILIGTVIGTAFKK